MDARPSHQAGGGEAPKGVTIPLVTWNPELVKFPIATGYPSEEGRKDPFGDQAEENPIRAQVWPREEKSAKSNPNKVNDGLKKKGAGAAFLEAEADKGVKIQDFKLELEYRTSGFIKLEQDEEMEASKLVVTFDKNSLMDLRAIRELTADTQIEIQNVAQTMKSYTERVGGYVDEKDMEQGFRFTLFGLDDTLQIKFKDVKEHIICTKLADLPLRMPHDEDPNPRLPIYAQVGASQVLFHVQIAHDIVKFAKLEAKRKKAADPKEKKAKDEGVSQTEVQQAHLAAEQRKYKEAQEKIKSLAVEDQIKLLKKLVNEQEIMKK
jgi:hypothetical protein